MVKPLTAQEKVIIQQAILDRWNPHRLTWKIANHFDLSENQVRHIKSKATFKAEYAKQLAIYQGSLDVILDEICNLFQNRFVIRAHFHRSRTRFLLSICHSTIGL